MSEGEWLAGLKAGDEVIVTGARLRDDYVARVDRLTPTLIVVVGGMRFRKANGRQVGATGWHVPRLVQAHDQRRLTLVAREAAAYLSNVQWYQLPYALALDIEAFVKRVRLEAERNSASQEPEKVGTR